MVYGLKSGYQLPQEDPELVRRLALRWYRASIPHNKWAATAKKCTDFLEGRQYSDAERAALIEAKRTPLTINKIAPLWRLVMGYQSSNRMDVSYLPTSDSASNEDVAAVLDAVFKAEGNRMDLKFVDSEVFADGITGGRGYWDLDLCFQENDYGELKIVTGDPYARYIDPDCHTYDIDDSAAYVQKSVWTDIDSINERFGSEAAQEVQNIFGQMYQSQILSYMGEQELSPARYFGQFENEKDMGEWADVYHSDFIDEQAKRVRIIESEYKIMKIEPCFIDLETGDMEAVPQEWQQKPEVIEKVMAYAEKRGNPLVIKPRPVRKVRKTITCGDILLYDRWSPFSFYSTIGYFPYFRRGYSKGMVEDLIDPQMEVNRKRSVLVDILNRNANSGWMYEEGLLDADQEENLKKYGSAPGIHVKYKRIPSGERPARIEPGGYPQGLDRLEEKATYDLNQISGINESAMGQMDNVQSGRAIEAKQRQAVMSIQMYSDNFARSKKVVGKKSLGVFQKYYTEERVFRIMGEDSSMAVYEINKKQQTGMNAVTRLNDITVGKYSVHVDEVPISATFKQAQFEETMMLLEKLGPIGMMLAQTSPDLIIDQTSLPRKQEWKEAMMAATQAMQQQQAAGLPPPDSDGTATPAQTKTPEGYVS